MADALEQFLQKRARDDYRDLDLLRPLIEDMMALEENNAHATAKMMALGFRLGLIDLDKDPKFRELIEHKLGINPLPAELLQEFQEQESEYAAKAKSSASAWILKLQPEPIEFMATHETLRLAENFGLMMAGEACKRIERTRPELIKQHADFPWASLKRLRNHHSHPTRVAHNPKQQQREDAAIEKEVARLGIK